MGSVYCLWRQPGSRAGAAVRGRAVLVRRAGRQPARPLLVSIGGVRRVSVIGSAGAGKSTLACRLARLLGCSWVELDSLYHQVGWTRLDRAELQQRAMAAADGEDRVIDGNYSVTSPAIWPGPTR